MTDIVSGRAAGHPLVQLLSVAANVGSGGADPPLGGAAAPSSAASLGAGPTAAADAASELFRLEVIQSELDRVI